MLELLLQANGNEDAAVRIAAIALILVVATVALLALVILAWVFGWFLGHYFKAEEFLEETKKLREAIETLARRP